MLGDRRVEDSHLLMPRAPYLRTFHTPIWMNAFKRRTIC
jgi:hypothetical protein